MRPANSISSPEPRRRFAWQYGVLAVLAVTTSLVMTRDIDFRVYWYALHGFYERTLPAYGPSSGIGFPMHYRYPPVSYLLLWPLNKLSLFWGGVLWMVGTWAVATAVVSLALRKMKARLSATPAMAACAFMLAYVVLTIRAGNIQPYLIAMIFAALLLSESHRAAAAMFMALAITFKVWPVFFLPWFLRRERRAVLYYLVPTILVLWLVPLLAWGPGHYVDLLGQWYRSEFHDATTNSENWYFPGQSLRGVLLRYLTPLGPWLKGFPDVHVLSLSPRMVVLAWGGIAAAAYLAACAAMLRSAPKKQWIWDGASFALFTVLQPFCIKSSMISMGPAALVAAIAFSRERRGLAYRLFLGACALTFLGAVIQYKPALQLLLAIGLDFYAALLMIAALLLLVRTPASAASRGSEIRETLTC